MAEASAPEIGRASVIAGGCRISYLHAGPDDGRVVVLVHGLGSDAETFDRVIGPLAERGLRVLAPDVIGHGRSDKPERSYLLEDLADSVRDFLDAVDIPSGTVCGHSLGGAIGMALASRAPDRVDALVLVAAGGLGREVHPLLRAASLPVAPQVLRLATRPRLRRVYGARRFHRALRLTPDNVANLRRAGRALGTVEGQAAFFASLRGVIEPARGVSGWWSRTASPQRGPVRRGGGPVRRITVRSFSSGEMRVSDVGKRF